MTWLALLLVGVGVSDLVFSARPMRTVPEGVGAAVAVLLGLLAGLTDPRDLVALLVIAAVVVAWGQTVTRGFARGPAWVPLAVLGLGLGAGLLLSGVDGTAGGAVARLVESMPLDDRGLLADADSALLLLGAVLVQLSTGNVVVRLVLAATDTVNPARHEWTPDDEPELKGGRLLGPMERLFILGLGLAGQLTAAAIVVAAKGLLRWPELSSKSEQQHIHRLTEYFLVGSFVSWLVALSALVLVGG